jgi:hypothetical protein
MSHRNDRLVACPLMTDTENSLHPRYTTVAKRLSYLPLRLVPTDRGCGRNDPAPIVGAGVRRMS